MTDDDLAKKAAYEKLETAIREVNDLQGWGRGPDGEPMVITDYVVLTAAQGFDAEGDGFSAVGWILAGGDMPWYRIVGIVRAAQLRIEHQLMRAEDD